MARGRPSSLVIVLSLIERETLERWQRSTTIAAGLAHQGKIILLLADRHSQSQVTQLVGVQRGVVRKWARRFLAQRLDGLADTPWPRGQGRFFPPRSRSTWYAWPASAQSRWAAVFPSGIVPNWRGSSSRRGALKRSLPPLGAGFWPRIN